MSKKRIVVQTIVVTLLAVSIISLMSAAGDYTAVAARRPYTSPTPTAGYFGYATIGQYTDRTPPGDKDSSRYQAPQTGTINSVSMYIQTPNAQVRYGLYTDNNGQPSQLIAQSNFVSTGTGNRWVTAPLSAQVTAGQYYWLTILSTSLVYWNYGIAAGASAGNGKDSTYLSSTYGSFLYWGTNKFSMIATYASASTTVTPTPVPSSTPTATPVPTSFPTATPVPTLAPTATPVPTLAPTATPAPTLAPTPIPTSGSTTQPVWGTNAEISSLSQLGISNSIWGSGTYNAVVSTERAHSGTKGIKLSTSSNRIELNMYPSSLIQNDFDYSWWLYAPSALSNPVGSEWLVLFQIEGSYSSGYYPIGKITIETGNPHMLLYWQDLSGHQTKLADSGISLPRDQWVHIEWYTKIGTNGELAAWMNGVKLWDVTGIDTSGLKLTTMYFMNTIYGKSGTCYVDDMALYNVNMNGKAP